MSSLIVRHLVVFFTSLAVFATSATAQMQRVATTTSATSEAMGEGQRVTVNVTRAPLILVLQTIAQQAGFVPMYNAALIPTDTRITLHLHNVTARDAFQTVLRGTGLVAQVRALRHVVIVPATNVPARNGTITGKVTDGHTQRPLRGATVLLDDATHGVTTDEDGVFHLADVGAGTHRMTVRLLGYGRSMQTVTVTDGQATTLHVVLSQSTHTLDQVVVTGTVIPTELKAVPNAITVITAKQLEERGVTHIDQLFRGEVPGVYAANSGGTISVNGGNEGNPFGAVLMFSRGATAFPGGNSAGAYNSTNPIKTYIDGVELADPHYLSQLDPKSIERIEILTGPQASTIYGSNAINGVMQIFTKRGQSSRPELVLDANSGMTQNSFNSSLAPAHHGSASVSGTEGRWSYNVTSSLNYTGSWTPGINTVGMSVQGGVRSQLAALTTDLSARAQQTRNMQRGDFYQQLINRIQTGEYMPGASVGVSTNGHVAPKTAILNGRTFGISLGYQLTPWWSHDIGVGVDQSNIESHTTGAGFTIKADTLLTFNQTWNARVSEHYTTTLKIPATSLAALMLTLGGDHWQTHTSSMSARTLSLTGFLGNSSIVRNTPGKNAGGFVQGQLGVKDALFFTYGLRAERNPNYGDKVKVLPGRYGVAYTQPIGPVTAKVRGSYGRSTRPPADYEKLPIQTSSSDEIETFGPYDNQLANPYLEPEYQQGGEGGLELYLGNRGSLVITRYNQTVDQLIHYIFAIDSVRSLMPYPPSIFDLYGSCSYSYGGGDGPYCYARQDQYLNVGSIRNQGWELRSTTNAGPLNVTGTYSWTKSRVLGITPRYRFLLNPTNYPELQPGAVFQRLAEHTWAVDVGYSQSRTSVSLAINGIGMVPGRGGDAVQLGADSRLRLRTYTAPVFILSNSFNPSGPGYATMDLNGRRTITSHLDATLAISNLTNTYHNDVYHLTAVPGRVTTLGARMRF